MDSKIRVIVYQILSIVLRKSQRILTYNELEKIDSIVESLIVNSNIPNDVIDEINDKLERFYLTDTKVIISINDDDFLMMTYDKNYSLHISKERLKFSHILASDDSMSYLLYITTDHALEFEMSLGYKGKTIIRAVDMITRKIYSSNYENVDEFISTLGISKLV